MKITGLKLGVLIVLTLFHWMNAPAQNTAFTYQGRLTGSGTPATGSFDLRFALFDAANAGSQVGSSLTNSPVIISNGLFTVTLNFGPSAFDGSPRWLEIGVRTNGGGAFRILPSRQAIASAPYSLFASRAGTMSWSGLTSVPAGFADGVDDMANYTAGSGITINGSQIAVRFDANGTSTNVSHADHTHVGAAWLAWANLAGIPAGFADGVDGDTTYSAGSGLGLAGTQFSVNFAGDGVAATAARSDHGHVGAPWLNWTNLAGIPAGISNSYTAGAGLLLSGSQFSANFAGNGSATTVARSDHSHVLDWSALTGVPAGFSDGADNDTTYSAGTGLALAGTQFSVNFAGNGTATTSARSDHNHTNQSWFSWANLAGIPAGFADGVDNGTTYTAGTGITLSGSQINVSFDSNGTSTNVSHADHSHVGASWLNWANLAGIPAGFSDGADNDTTYSAGTGLALAGTQFSVNFAGNGTATTSARSDHNHTNQSWFSWANLAGIPAGFADGTDNDTAYTAGNGLALAGNQFNVNFAGNGAANSAARSDHNHHGQTWLGTNYDGLIAQTTATNGTGLHGLANIGTDGYGVFGEASNGFGVVGSGGRYGVYGYSAFGFSLFGQSGGNQFFPQLVLLQETPSESCRIRMGTTGWPQWNIAVTSGATPRMEFFNGSTNVMIVDFLGNVSAKTFTPSSDRNIKDRFRDLDPRDVLAKVAQLPIQTWIFKDDPDVRHVGPMAQDFYAAFNVGPDDKHIATVDADGVALAAIQGLNEVVQEKDAKITALEKRLAELEKLVATLATKR
jgi:hypothetical protein